MESRKQNILITGGTSGLGLELVKLFINYGYNVTVTGRKLPDIPDPHSRLRMIRVDFNDLTKVAESVNLLFNYVNQFNIVINNAGVLSPPAFESTINGFEYTYQVNYLSHLLINEIILQKKTDDYPLILAAVTSPAYRFADKNLTAYSGNRNYSPVKAYSSSKLYLSMMCEFLPGRFPDLNLHCFSFDPGTFSSGIYRMQNKWFRDLYRIASPFMGSPGKAAKVLAELILQGEAGNGMIYNLKKCARSLPSMNEMVKANFIKDCYEEIAPFICNSRN